MVKLSHCDKVIIFKPSSEKPINATMVVTVRKVSQIPPPHPRKECCFATHNHIGD